MLEHYLPSKSIINVQDSLIKIKYIQLAHIFPFSLFLNIQALWGWDWKEPIQSSKPCLYNIASPPHLSPCWASCII
jgi:hypothetical protein